mmetsp:Transcript_9450/g.38649  ORF Transcript_9450/g.38649 Transcript_9450/m.38649 type:complete len:493 (-) Transcript_9450:531-2009(-)
MHKNLRRSRLLLLLLLRDDVDGRLGRDSLRVRPHERDHAVERRHVGPGGGHHDVGVRAGRHERPRLHVARLHVGLHHRPRHCLIALGADAHAGLRQGLDPLDDRVHGVLDQVHLDAAQAVDRLVRGVDGSGADGGVDPRHRVGSRHLDGGGGEAHGAAHHLHLVELPSDRGVVALARARCDQRDDLVVAHAARLLLRDELEAVKHLVELVSLQREAQLLELGLQRVPTAVLAHDDAHVALAAKVSDSLGRDDLVRLLVLEHAVLVNAGLVREGVGADDRLVRLNSHAGVLPHHLGARVDVHRVDAGVRAEDLLLTAHPDGHRHLLQARVTRALADAVDGALNLPRAVGDAREGVGGGQAEVVLAVRGNDVLARDVRLDARDELAELLGEADADGVRDVQRRRARLDNRGENAVEELGVGPARVLGGELHVLAPEGPGVGHAVHRDLHHLVGGLAELGLHVNLGSRDEGVNAGAPGVPDALPRGVDVLLVSAG